MTTMWVVEQENRATLNSTVMHIASSFELAEKYVKNFKVHDMDHGGFIIYPEPLDLDDEQRITWMQETFPMESNIPISLYELNGQKVNTRTWYK